MQKDCSGVSDFREIVKKKFEMQQSKHLPNLPNLKDKK